MEVVGVGLVVSALWCALAIRIGPAVGFVDRADGDPALKVHRRDAVPLGGVGVYLAFLASLLLRDEFDATLFSAATLVLILGLIDERVDLSPLLRLGVEAAAAVILVVGWGLADKGVVYAIVAGALVVTAINAVNLFDGLDGLAGSAAAVTAVGMVVLAGLNAFPATVSLATAAGLGGFLLFNWHPARVFLGDGGSYLLGVLLAAEIIRASPSGELQLLTTAAMLGVFVVDLVVTLIRRRAHRRPLFEGDRSHVYDQLRDRGMPVQKVVLVAIAAQVGLVGVAVAIREALGAVTGFVVAAALLLGVTALLAWLGFTRAGERAL